MTPSLLECIPNPKTAIVGPSWAEVTQYCVVKKIQGVFL